MSILNNFIYSFDILVVKLLVPIIGLSIMPILVLIFILLSNKTKDKTYIFYTITLALIFIYNLFLFTIIFLEIQGDKSRLANTLYVYNNILILIILTLVPINTQSFIKKNKAINIFNNSILIITIITVPTLIIYSIINFKTSFYVTINYYNILSSSSYTILPFGKFYLYKMYIIFFVILASLISIILDMIINYNIKANIIFALIMIFALYLILKDIQIFSKVVNISYDRTGFAIILAYLVGSIVTFFNFTRNALETIKNQNILNDKLKHSLKIIKSIDNTSKELKNIDKDIMKSSEFVLEIDNEYKDALNIITKQTEELNNDIEALRKSRENNAFPLSEFMQFVNTYFIFFDKYKSQIKENCKILEQTTIKMNEIDTSSEEIFTLNENLKNIRNSFSNTTISLLNHILESSKNLENVNQITTEIKNTIIYIKNVTERTNLLSINAGIQASKAGMFGKSFSVVAKEIGALAFEISRITDSIEKILNEIFSSIIVLEKYSLFIKENCEYMEKDIQSQVEEIDNLIKNIERTIENNYNKKSNYKTLEKYNAMIYSLANKQDTIISFIKENINSITGIQKTLNSRIKLQNKETENIINELDSIKEVRKEISEIIKDINKNSSSFHTYSETLFDTVSKHKEKSSLAFSHLIDSFKNKI